MEEIENPINVNILCTVVVITNSFVLIRHCNLG